MSESAAVNWRVGDVIADLYEVTGVLGEGAFGIVRSELRRVKSEERNSLFTILTSDFLVLPDDDGRVTSAGRRTPHDGCGLHPHIASCYCMVHGS
jgi:hypothetical protein